MPSKSTPTYRLFRSEEKFPVFLFPELAQELDVSVISVRNLTSYDKYEDKRQTSPLFRELLWMNPRIVSYNLTNIVRYNFPNMANNRPTAWYRSIALDAVFSYARQRKIKLAKAFVLFAGTSKKSPTRAFLADQPGENDIFSGFFENVLPEAIYALRYHQGNLAKNLEILRKILKATDAYGGRLCFAQAFYHLIGLEHSIYSEFVYLYGPPELIPVELNR